MPRPTFAAIGHQQDWDSIAAMVNGMRQRERPGSRPLSQTEVETMMDFLPPRVTSRFTIGSGADEGSKVEAIYIETFIRPDELSGKPGRSALGKVRQAIEVAAREGAKIAALGGFTSILVEAGAGVPQNAPTLTSGNTLTAALIVRGLEGALALHGRSLSDEEVLVIGATGDVGSGVTRWIGGRCRRLVLAARNVPRLERLIAELSPSGNVDITTDVGGALTRATVVVAAASTSDIQFSLEFCRPGTILCDAGYPKNMEQNAPPGIHVFHGGMGCITGGLNSHDGLLEQFYRFPLPDVAHGCMLEGAVLALSGHFEPYSQGRGRIWPQAIDEIWFRARECGVSVAPHFNAEGLWPGIRNHD